MFYKTKKYNKHPTRNWFHDETKIWETEMRKSKVKSYKSCAQVAKMSRACCPACTSAVHLTSTSPALASHLLEQTVCAICWRPLLTASYPSTTLLNLATSEVGRSSFHTTSSSSNLVPRPLLSACGHLFHPGCLEDRGRTYPDTPDRSLPSFLATLISDQTKDHLYLCRCSCSESN